MCFTSAAVSSRASGRSMTGFASTRGLRRGAFLTFSAGQRTRSSSSTGQTRLGDEPLELGHRLDDGRGTLVGTCAKGLTVEPEVGRDLT
jgi:hypothetical protein